MIPSIKIPNCIDEFNLALHKHCSRVTVNGELAAMAGWVNSLCLNDLNGILANYIKPPNAIRFRLAWIDKSPIATYTYPGTTGSLSGELADAAIVRLHVHRNKVMLKGSMLLLQAKASKDAPPFIPSQVCTGMTPKEWAFMASWPPFDLKAWGASGNSVGSYDPMDGIPLSDRQAVMQEMAWFGVAPFYVANKNGWDLPPYDKCPWWTGPPVPGQACDTELSKLLLKVALVSNSSLLGTHASLAGRAFTVASSPPALLPPKVSIAGALPPQSWDDLCNEIIRLAAANDPASQQLPGDKRVIGMLTKGPSAAYEGSLLATYKGRGSHKPFPVIFVTLFE